MTKEIEWYRTAQGDVYRAIRWDSQKSRYILISDRRNPGFTGDTDFTQIEFEDPKILADAIVRLAAYREVSIQAEGTVTRIHEEWELRPLKKVETGQVNLTLKAEHGALAAFESTVQIHVE